MKKYRLVSIIIAAALTLTALCSCGRTIDGEQVTSATEATDSPPVREAYPVSFDSETFESSPASVASLSPALTEILCELGLADRIAGVSSYCEKPREDMPEIGSPAFPDIDRIIELSPELLITQSPLASTDVVRLKQAGIRTLYLPVPSSFAYLCEEYIRISLIFYGNVDSRQIAEAALAGIEASMLEAQSIEADISFICVRGTSDGGYIVDVCEGIENDMLSVYGENLLLGRESAFISEEELSELEPDVIFADIGLMDEYEDELEELTGSDPELIYIDCQAFERPSSNLSGVIFGITTVLAG